MSKAVFACVSALFLSSCGSLLGDVTLNGACTIVPISETESILACSDGSEVTITAGEDGKEGQDGLTGIEGAPGTPGEDGGAGIAGRDGNPGPEGAPGEGGEPGAAGSPGDPGEPGAGCKVRCVSSPQKGYVITCGETEVFVKTGTCEDTHATP